MFCPNCGAKLPDGCKFCGQCGTQLRLSAVQSPGKSDIKHDPAASPAADRQQVSTQQASAQSAAADSSARPQGNNAADRITRRQGTAASDSGIALQGIDLAAAICLWVLTAICAFMLILSFLAVSPRRIFTYLIRVVVFVMLALICTYNMRGEQCQEEKDDIFLCVEAALVLSVIAFVIDLISRRSGWVETVTFLAAAAVTVIYYFRLGNPETLITKPYAAVDLPDAVKNLLQIQKNIRAQIKAQRKAAQQEAAEMVNRHLTNLVRMIVGICGAVLQMASMYLPMVSVNVSLLEKTVYSQGLSFMTLMADDELTFIPMILLVLGAAEIVLFILRYKKLALIPGVVQIVGLALMLMMYQDILNKYGGFYMGNIALFTYPCGTIAVLVAPFIKIRKRET